MRIKFFFYPFLLFIGFLFFNLFASPSYAASNSLSWVYKTSMPTARYALRSVAATDGKIYVFGGNDGTQILNTVEAYDPSTDTWATKSAMPIAAENVAAVQANNGEIYIIGGQINAPGSGFSNAVQQYDPATDTWTLKNNIPFWILPSGFAAAGDGKIYLVGGNISYDNVTDSVTSSVFEYDPSTDSWVTKTNSPITPPNFNNMNGDLGNVIEATTGNDGLVYIVIGGTLYDSVRNRYSSGTVEQYDPSTDTWTLRSHIPETDANGNYIPNQGYANFGIASTNTGKIYTFGGSNVGYGTLATVNEYDITSDTWTYQFELPWMNTPRSSLTSVFGSNGKFYSLGGFNPNFTTSTLDTVEQATIDYAPNIATLSAATINVGSTYTANGSFTDSDSTSWTATVDYGDGSGAQPLTLSGTNFSLNHTYNAVGTYTVTVSITDNQGATSSTSTTVTVQRQLVTLNPTNVWVGLTANNQSGIKFDIQSQLFVNGVLISTGQVNSVSGGTSSKFSGAVLSTIPFASFSPVNFPSTSTLNVKIFVRNACSGSTKSSGSARLWYNSSSANSDFGATIGTSASSYYLSTGSTLLIIPGTSQSSIDVAVGAQCGPFVQFGTWSKTF